jgi:hypothetical protein
MSPGNRCLFSLRNSPTSTFAAAGKGCGRDYADRIIAGAQVLSTLMTNRHQNRSTKRWSGRSSACRPNRSRWPGTKLSKKPTARNHSEDGQIREHSTSRGGRADRRAAPPNQSRTPCFDRQRHRRDVYAFGTGQARPVARPSAPKPKASSQTFFNPRARQTVIAAAVHFGWN